LPHRSTSAGSQLMAVKGNVPLFNDVHRWVALQADEIETLRARHQRLNTRRKEAIAMCNQTLKRDTDERKKQMNEFSLEMEQYTLRKFDLLQDDVYAAHLEKSHAENDELAWDEVDNIPRKQRRINTLSGEMDILHDSLAKVCHSMVDLAKACCGPSAVISSSAGQTHHQAAAVMDATGKAKSTAPSPAMTLRQNVLQQRATKAPAAIQT